LVLREYRLDDWEAVHVYNSNAEALRFESWGPNSAIQTKAFVRKAMDQLAGKHPRRLELAVCLKQDGRLIGGCGLRLGEPRKGMATIGYTFNPAFWGMGYATEAAMGMIELAKEMPGIHTLFAACDSQNLASQRVLEKCGLQAVGMIAELEMVKGRFRDMLLYERIL
jgi:RimJ/RimL family protein N-acetyltransferase